MKFQKVTPVQEHKRPSLLTGTTFIIPVRSDYAIVCMLVDIDNDLCSSDVVHYAVLDDSGSTGSVLTTMTRIYYLETCIEVRLDVTEYHEVM